MSHEDKIVYLTEVVMRQTDYDNITARNKVIDFSGNIIEIVREYMNPPKKVEKKNTINQEIYGQIRGMMDTAATNFRQQQELNKLRAQYAEYIKRNQVVENIAKPSNSQ